MKCADHIFFTSQEDNYFWTNSIVFGMDFGYISEQKERNYWE